MERSGRFDPNIGMKICQPLVIIRLGIFGDRSHIFVRLADPVAKRQWPFQNLFRHMGPLLSARVA
ncbi:MAG: hypothetical protein WBE37_24440 [Bryobacteraceae bacterium]